MDKQELYILHEHRHLTLKDLEGRGFDVDKFRDLIARQHLASATDLADNVHRALQAVPLVGKRIASAYSRIRDAFTGSDVDDHKLDDLAQQVTKMLEAIERATDDQPIETVPALAPLLAKARLHNIATLAGGDDRWVDEAASRGLAVGGLDAAGIDQLVRAGVLDEQRGRSLAVVATVYDLADGDAEIAHAILHAKPGSLGGRTPASTEDLARVSRAEWQAALGGVRLPDSTDPVELADALAERFGALHPGVSLVGKLPSVKPGVVLKDVEALSPLLAKNPRIADVDFDALDTADLQPAERERLAKAHGELRAIVRAYPGLGLAEVLDDPQMPADAKAATMARRVGYVQAVHKKVGEDRALELDYSARSSDVAELDLAGLGATPDEQRLVLRTLKAHQRAYALSLDGERATKLLGAGLTSAKQVADLDYDTFVARTGLAGAIARKTYDRARDLVGDASVTVGAMLEAWLDRSNLTFINLRPDARDYLREIDGFDKLFGTLSFCNCSSCQSILGPAAYFVDLMKYVDVHIRKHFDGRPNHPLDLRTRRPDLWTLPLTCENTNELVAVLEIVDEILESYIAASRGFAGTPTDKAKQVYRLLADAAGSFGQPFHYAIARADVHLRHLQTSRADVAAAFGVGDEAWAAALLGVGPREWTLITQASTAVSALVTVYGISFQVAGTAIAAVDVQQFLPRMGLTREQFGALVRMQAIAHTGANVEIRAQKRAPSSVQNDVENVIGLTPSALDRMHRLTRLRRRLGWTFEELDRVLVSLATAPGATEPTPEMVVRVARFRALEVALAMPLDELCAVLGTMPAQHVSPLFDRVFNPAGAASTGARLPDPAAMFVHPALRDSTAPADRNVSRLSTSLGLELADLERLIRALAPYLESRVGTPPLNQLGFDPSDPVEDQRGFLLTFSNLALLYRYVRLARALKLSIEDLLQVVSLSGVSAPLDTLAKVQAVVDWHTWQRTSGYRLDDIALATGQAVRDPARYPDPGAIAAAVVDGARDALEFERTVFAVALGMTEEASSALVRSLAAPSPPAPNPPIVALSGDRYSIAAGVDIDTAPFAIPATAVVPDAAGGTRLVTAGEIRDVLRGYTGAEVLARRLGTALRLDPQKIAAIAAFAGVDLAQAALVQALRDEVAAALVPACSTLVRYAVAFQAAVWDRDAIAHVAANPAAYDIAAAPALTTAALRAFSTYARIAARRHGLPPDDTAVNPGDLRAAITAYVAPPDPSAGYPASVDDQLARVLGISRGVVVTLRGRVPVAGSALAMLETLDRIATLASHLGVDGEAISALLSTDFDTLERAADAVQAAVRGRYQDAGEQARQLEQLAQPLRELRRDALADYIVRTLHPSIFNEVSDLSPYFLLDIEAGGCQTTSRVIAATNSVQLYVQRVILNLEQDRRAASDPLHVAIQLSEDAIGEWSWRKNYRVWEANRKVFLWPENYLEPDLRDDKTPLFRELESELLQTEVTEQNVLDAYSKYLKGFEELASLTIAGACHEMRPGDDGEDERDVLHLFGVANTDPPIFYYRTCENLLASGRDPTKSAVWSPWRKVEVQITGRRVAPVILDGRLHLFWTDIKTRAVNSVSDGATSFAGYTHTMRMYFTTLQVDGNWTAPQQVELPATGPNVMWRVTVPLIGTITVSLPAFGPGRGTIQDRRFVSQGPRLAATPHDEAIDDYTLSGPNWDTCWPEQRPNGSLIVRYRNFVVQSKVDLFTRTTSSYATAMPSSVPQLLATRGSTLYSGVPSTWMGGRDAFPNLVIEERRLDLHDRELIGSKAIYTPGLYQRVVATLRPDTHLLAIPGNVQDVILQHGSDVILLQGSITPDTRYVARRIGTTLARDIARRLFTSGVDELLSITTQRALREAGMPLTPAGGQIIDRTNANKLDFVGAYGTYYREIFFQIPFLIANHLNSQGRFAAAQRWYHFIFDPTATEVINVPPGTSDAERERRLRDRVWRYLEFRGRDADNLRATLTDPEALEKYRRDPFNPHAIARLRISAYQKAVVMKYVDNLIDWADHLFTQFTRESINEALLLYLMAADILGPRPAELGECGEGGVRPRDYEHIAPHVEGTDDLLVEVENWIVSRRWQVGRVADVRANISIDLGIDRPRVTRALASRTLPIARAVQPMTAEPAPEPEWKSPSKVIRAEWKDAGPIAWTPALASGSTYGAAVAGARETPRVDPATGVMRGLEPTGRVVGVKERPAIRPNVRRRFPWEIIRQVTPVFCIPPNRDLLAYWDRVGDRLFKIRHCLDINGVKRELPLLAPEIDPRLLVRARAAGISLDDLLATASGNLPPYRFLFLVDRAKALAGTVQAFGNALLAALEKRDGEELARLRTVQSKNLALFTTKIRDWEVRVAEESLEATRRQKESAETRRDFYQGLLDRDRNGWEIAESAARHVAAGIRAVQGAMGFVAAFLTAIPEVGSPFAMKYGGIAIGGMAGRFFDAIGTLAVIADSVASSASLEAGYERRRETWSHQRDLAAQDVRALDKQVMAADLRVKIAQRSVELHQKSLEQIDEVLELMDGKFTSLGLYTWMSQQLQRLYRDAYNSALALAKLAEQAYRFERGDDTSPGIEASYWEPGRAGLLAGERLLIDLTHLERRFLETNHRRHEVDQAFSIGQIAPAALLELRETGTCEVEIPEFYFDLYYPGHYRREIKGVRLTIPCITGPYVNVSATLELLGSQLRTDPAGALIDVPPRRTTSIATSTAQNDAGVFELSFRDERYMPFEGAGAVSRWRITLPKTFKPFDYRTITDVILSISYTAELDGTLRTKVEQGLGGAEALLLSYVRNNSLTRVFSLRQEFSSAFTRLLHSPANTEVRFEINDRHFPVFAQGKILTPTSALLVARVAPGASLAGFAVTIDGAPLAGPFAPRAELGNLAGAPLPPAFTSNVRPRTHSLVVTNPGAVAPTTPAPGDSSAIDAEKLHDLLLYVDYTLS